MFGTFHRSHRGRGSSLISHDSGLTGDQDEVSMILKAERWRLLDERFVELQGDLDLDNYLAPRNRAGELEIFRQRVESGESYNPRFTYDPVPETRKNKLRELLEDLDPADPVEKIYVAAVTYRLGEIEAALEHTGELVTESTLRMFGRPDEWLLSTAAENLKSFRSDGGAREGEKEGKVYDAEMLAVACREAMTRYGFDWKVVVKPEMGCKASVDNLIREFWIRADVKFPESSVKMVVVHEIGVHILRSENGYAQPLELFGRGLPAYQFTEEGLAEYAEEESGIPMEDIIHRISGRVIGVDVALRGSFWDVYCSVRDHFDLDMAFDIAQRAKLGIADTSQPGSYTKDYTYLAGLLKVREFFKTATREEIDAVFAGKIGFHHLETVRDLQKEGYLKRPKALPDWVKTA